MGIWMLIEQYYREPDFFSDRRINPELAAGGRTSQMSGLIRLRIFGPSMIETHLTPGEGGAHPGAGGGGAPTGLATAGGAYPWSSMDPERPGLSSFGEPHSC